MTNIEQIKIYVRQKKIHWLCRIFGHKKGGLHGNDKLNWCRRCVWYKF
jgi:hypothetical protein